MKEEESNAISGPEQLFQEGKEKRLGEIIHVHVAV